MGFDINQKHNKKTNGTSSDLMDKILSIRSEDVPLVFFVVYRFKTKTYNRMEINL